MKKLLSTLFISSALLFVGCEGDEGPAGPAGPTGNANVKTQTFSVLPGDWQVLQTQTGSTLYLDTNLSILTDANIEAGSAHLYYQTNTSNHPQGTFWAALPTSYMYYYLSKDEGLTINSGIPFHLTGDTAMFKMVTVQGQLQNAKVDFNNFDDVQQYFGLED